jgi:hypothetical protein
MMWRRNTRRQRRTRGGGGAAGSSGTGSTRRDEYDEYEYDDESRPAHDSRDLHAASQAEIGRRRAENERQRAEHERQRAEHERLRAEHERLRAENERLRAEIEENAALLSGTYYATIDQVWARQEAAEAATGTGTTATATATATTTTTTATTNFGCEMRDYTDLVRDGPPTFVAAVATRSRAEAAAPAAGCREPARWCAVYERTKECAEDNDAYGAMADAASSSPSSRGGSSSSSCCSSSSALFEAWPVDIFGGSAHDGPHVARLLPDTYDEAGLYRDVAIAALGLRPDAGWETTQKAIHGSASAAAAASAITTTTTTTDRADGCAAAIGDDEAAAAEEEEEEEEKVGSGAAPSCCSAPACAATGEQRVPGTGIKHFATNRIRLPGQRYFLEAAPCVLVVPVLSLEQAKDWNGEGYRAVVVVGPWGCNSVKDVCRAIAMQKKKEPFAGPGEVEIARHLLERVVRGLACSLLQRFPDAVAGRLNAAQKAALDELRAKLRGRGLVVPKASGGGGGGRRAARCCEPPPRVRMVEFGSASSSSPPPSATGLHPAPDPLLLAVRAAVNWSARHGQRLLPAAAAEHKDDTDDELDRLAEEEFLEWREEEQERQERQWRHPSEAELARRLGQPHGYQETGRRGGRRRRRLCNAFPGR